MMQLRTGWIAPAFGALLLAAWQGNLTNAAPVHERLFPPNVVLEADVERAVARTFSAELTTPFRRWFICAYCTECPGIENKHSAPQWLFDTGTGGRHAYCNLHPWCNHPDCVRGEGEEVPPGEYPEADCGEGCDEEEVPLPDPLSTTADNKLRAYAGITARYAFDGNERALELLVTAYSKYVHYDADDCVLWVEGCTPQGVSALIPVAPEVVTRLLNAPAAR